MTITTRNKPRDIVQHSVAEALRDQPWYQRRKDTITQIAGYVLQFGNLATVYFTDAPLWVMGVVAVIIAIAQVAIIAGTKGAVTPSMIDRLGEKADEIPETTPIETVAENERSYEEILKDRYGR